MKNKKATIVFLITGFTSLVWFLIRVIPKPSRATYPCQRAAFPVASAFVIWIASGLASITLFKKMKQNIRGSRMRVAYLMFFAAIITLGISFIAQPGVKLVASALITTDVEPVERYTGNILEELPARVGVVKSGKADVFDLKYSDVEDMVYEAIEKAGGLGGIINDNDVVVLKPNLLKPPKAADIEFNGVVTNVHVLKAVAKKVRSLNPNGEILVMEGTAAESTADYFKDCGYDDIDEIDEFIAFEEESGSWRDYKSSKLTSVELPDSISLFPDSRKPNKSRELYFNKRYFEADVIISLPCLKNHYQSEVTGAVKNVAQGCTPANIYGVEGRFGNTSDNWRNLRNDHLDHASEYIHLWLHDFYAARPVDFSVMDGLQGVEKGPAGGRSGSNLRNTQKNARLILASKDAVAMDAVASLIMTHDPQKVNYLIYLHNHKKGVVDPALIDVVGASVMDNRVVYNLSNADPGIGVSEFTNPTIKSYQVTAEYNGANLDISVANVDMNLARITLWFDNDDKKKYIVGGFEKASVPLTGFTINEGELNLLIEDKYLNAKTQVISLGTPNSFENSFASSIALFPNPVVNELNITAKSGFLSTVRVYDLQGSLKEEVLVGTGQNSIRIDLSTYPRGSYMVQLESARGIIENRKIVKM